jgi:lipoyl synthase
MEETKINSRRKPDWLKIRLPLGDTVKQVRGIIDEHKLNTICTSGACPNQAECWGAGTATFMILGDICTRACKFCNVNTGKPLPADYKEPARVAGSIRLMKVKHAVITSVDRDDMEDGGAEIWAMTIRKVRELNPNTTMEVLIGDFNGIKHHIQKVIDEKPEVISHNMETVRRLTPVIRTRAKYDLSLKVLKQVVESGIRSKSGIMLGLGETEEEILQTMDDLREIGVEVLTIGQYLQPTKNHIEVQAYIDPEVFKKYGIIGLEKGFRHVESGPLVRSSYHAEKHIQ